AVPVRLVRIQETLGIGENRCRKAPQAEQERQRIPDWRLIFHNEYRALACSHVQPFSVGKESRKTPCFWTSAQRLPPCASTLALLMISPNPSPLDLVE